MTENLVLEVGYQGNEGHKLERLRLYNQPILKSGPADAHATVRRVHVGSGPTVRTASAVLRPGRDGSAP